MKIVIGLFAVIGVVGYFVFTSADFANFDPSQQGCDARAAVEVGMSWDQVASSAGKPLKYRPRNKRTKRSGPRELEWIEPGPKITFSDSGLRDRLTQGSLAHGFLFDYRFSHSVSFRVSFDSEGLVTGIEDLTTMADLLQTRD